MYLYILQINIMVYMLIFAKLNKIVENTATMVDKISEL